MEGSVRGGGGGGASRSSLGPPRKRTALLPRAASHNHHDARPAPTDRPHLRAKVGVKMEFRGHQGRLAVYLGNKTVAALTAISTEVSPCSALALDSSAVTSTVQPGAQTQQLFNVECTAFYGEAPQLSLQFAAAGGSVQHVRLQLPLVPTKFLQPLEATGPEFFRRWKLLDGKELQQIFKLPATPLADKKVEEVLCAGLHFALLKGLPKHDSRPPLPFPTVRIFRRCRRGNELRRERLVGNKGCCSPERRRLGASAPRDQRAGGHVPFLCPF